MTVHPEDKTLAGAVAACRAAVGYGRSYVNCHTPDGFTVCAQLSDGFNTRTRSIRVHVWKDGKLVRKADWVALCK